jgi:hypothetical protein
MNKETLIELRNTLHDLSKLLKGIGDLDAIRPDSPEAATDAPEGLTGNKYKESPAQPKKAPKTTVYGQKHATPANNIPGIDPLNLDRQDRGYLDNPGGESL